MSSESETWIEVYSEAGRYYINERTKQTEWILPRGASLYDEQSDGGNVHIAKHNEKTFQSSQGNDIATFEREDVESSWRLRLHPDSGQVYYFDTTTGDTSWESPFHDAEATRANLQDTQGIDDIEQAQLETLAGFGLAPDVAVFRNTEAVHARASLERWVEENNLEITEEDMMRIKWAEYTDILSDPDNTGVTIIVWLDSIQTQKVLPQFVKIESLGLLHTVEDLLQCVFDAIDADSLRINRDKHYFKLRGFAEFILHIDYKLGYYDSISSASRRGREVHLTLIKLLDADIMDIGQLLAASVEDEFIREREKSKRILDIYTTNKATTIAEDGARWQDIKYIPLAEVKWPLRALIELVSHCPQELSCNTVTIEATLMNNGVPLSDPACTKSVAPEPNLRLLEEWTMLSPVSISNLPVSTRIRFLLTGRKKDGSRLVLSGAAIPLLNYKRELIQGKQTIRLWPHEDLQCARDPKLGKGENLPKNLRVDSGSSFCSCIFDN